MPNMSGFEVLERLAEVAPQLGHISFVFLTALTDRDNELKGRQLGADDYVTKPIMASYIARRKFLAALGGAAVAWPLAARAQQPAMPVVGFLHSASARTFGHAVTAFRRGLRETGMSTGRMWRSNTDGRTVNMTACRHLRPI